MGNLKPAAASPRFAEDGSLRWYANDTFEMNVTITITDPSSSPVTILPNDQIVFSFRSMEKREVLAVSYKGSSMSGDTVTLKMTEEYSSRLPIGTYTLDIIFIHNDIKTTISRGNRVIVE